MVYTGFHYSIFIDVPYSKQIDGRKREYYPATVVDKSYYESCSKSSCIRNYNVTVLIEGSEDNYENIHTTEEAYVSATIGGKISFERHLTDPVVLQQESKRVMFVGALLGLLGVFFCSMLQWVVCPHTGEWRILRKKK
jgi:hypothetical protein